MAKRQIKYESEHTRFMREWLERHPEQTDVQKTGRALWWDKPQNLQEMQKAQESLVRRKGYYYS